MSCYKCERCSCKTPKWTRYEFTNFYSDKFWEYNYATDGSLDLFVRFGKIGTNGTKLVKHFDSSWERNEYVAMKIREKVREGYEKVASRV